MVQYIELPKGTPLNAEEFFSVWNGHKALINSSYKLVLTMNIICRFFFINNLTLINSIGSLSLVFLTMQWCEC